MSFMKSSRSNGFLRTLDVEHRLDDPAQPVDDQPAHPALAHGRDEILGEPVGRKSPALRNFSPSRVLPLRGGPTRSHFTDGSLGSGSVASGVPSSSTSRTGGLKPVTFGAPLPANESPMNRVTIAHCSR